MIPALPESYADCLSQVETDIAQSRQRATLAVNTELKQLYHRLGSEIRQPEHASRLNFYLAVMDALIKAGDEMPTSGLLLCKQQNRLVAEYALSGIDKPIAVAEYQLLRKLPETLGRNLPSIAEIEAELVGELNTGRKVE